MIVNVINKDDRQAGRPGLRNKIPGTGRLIRAKPVMDRPGLQKVGLCYPLEQKVSETFVCMFESNLRNYISVI